MIVLSKRKSAEIVYGGFHSIISIIFGRTSMCYYLFRWHLSIRFDLLFSIRKQRKTELNFITYFNANLFRNDEKTRGREYKHNAIAIFLYALWNVPKNNTAIIYNTFQKRLPNNKFVISCVLVDSLLHHFYSHVATIIFLVRKLHHHSGRFFLSKFSR